VQLVYVFREGPHAALLLLLLLLLQQHFHCIVDHSHSQK
jgi:hypothetical protein